MPKSEIGHGVSITGIKDKIVVYFSYSEKNLHRHEVLNAINLTLTVDKQSKSDSSVSVRATPGAKRMIRFHQGR